MAKQLNKKIAEFDYDHLIVDAYPPTDTFMVKITAGGGMLKRGTVLARSEKDGTMVVLGSEAATGDVLSANCILCDDVDATEDVTALAYRTGHFASNALIVKTGYTLKDTDKEALRSMGILISDASTL